MLLQTPFLVWSRFEGVGDDLHALELVRARVGAAHVKVFATGAGATSSWSTDRPPG